ncbi:MAG: C40 family peptidase [Thermoflavifilum sp.]|nr:C40 family peptidase [Thermoflavifilum sp.]
MAMHPHHYIRMGLIGLLGWACMSIGCSSMHYAHRSTQPQQTASLRFIDDIQVSPGKVQSAASSSRTEIGTSPTTERKKSFAPTLQNKYAQIMQVSPAQITNLALYQFIDNWWGTPYKYGGNDQQGIDCSAFVQRLYDAVYHIHLERTALGLYRMIDFIRHPSKLSEGDLVFFHTGHGKKINHVGIYLQNNYFVQASTTSGVTISNLSYPYWKQHYAGGGRVNGMNQQDMAGR